MLQYFFNISVDCTVDMHYVPSALRNGPDVNGIAIVKFTIVFTNSQMIYIRNISLTKH